jgi:hypothetical protein
MCVCVCVCVCVLGAGRGHWMFNIPLARCDSSSVEGEVCWGQGHLYFKQINDTLNILFLKYHRLPSRVLLCLTGQTVSRILRTRKELEGRHCFRIFFLNYFNFWKLLEAAMNEDLQLKSFQSVEYCMGRDDGKFQRFAETCCLLPEHGDCKFLRNVRHLIPD